MVIYRNTQFFSQFYNIAPNNPTLFSDKFVTFPAQFKNAINGLYGELEKSNPDNKTCGTNRNFIRNTIAFIVPQLNKTHNPKYPKDWVGGQQDPVDFLGILTKIFSVNTSLPILHDRGFKYKAGNIENVENINQELKKVQPELYKSYVSTTEYYMYTFTFNNHNGEPDSDIFDESVQHPPEKLTLDELKTMLVSGIDLPGNNSLVRFSGCDIINNKYNKFIRKNNSGEWEIIDKSIMLNEKPFAYCVNNNLQFLDRTTADYQSLFPGVDIKQIQSTLNYNKICEKDNKTYTIGQNKIDLDTTITFDNMLFASWYVAENAPIYIINVNRVVQISDFSATQRFIDTQIVIPETLTNTCMEPNIIYRFIGAIVHAGFKEGTRTSGHYTAFILNPADNNYYFYNDMGEDKLIFVGDFNKVLEYKPSGTMTANIKTNCTTLFYLPEEEINQVSTPGGTYTPHTTNFTQTTKGQSTPQNKESEAEVFHNASEYYYAYNTRNNAQINFIVFK